MVGGRPAGMEDDMGSALLRARRRSTNHRDVIFGFVPVRSWPNKPKAWLGFQPSCMYARRLRKRVRC